MKTIYKRLITACGAIIILATVCGSYLLLSTQSASASTKEITKDEIRTQALMYALKKCYTTSGVLVSSISYESEIHPSVFVGNGEIFTGSTVIDIPNGYLQDYENKGKMNDVPCAHKGIQYSGYHGVPRQLYSGDEPNTSVHTERTAFYEGMGYTASGGTGASSGVKTIKCWYLEFQYGSPAQRGNTNEVCFGLDENGTIVSIISGTKNEKNAVDNSKGVKYTVYLLAGWNNVEITGGIPVSMPLWTGRTRSNLTLGLFVNACMTDNTHCEIAYASIASTGEEFRYSEWEDVVVNEVIPGYTIEDEYGEWTQASLAQSITDYFNQHAMEGYKDKVTSNSFNITSSDLKISERQAGQAETDEKNVYTISDGVAGYKAAYKYLAHKADATDEEIEAGVTFDDTERYYVYFHYLDDYNAGLTYSICQDTKPDNKAYIPVVKKESGTKKWAWCLLNNYTLNQWTQADNSFDDSGVWGKVRKHTLDDVVTVLRGFDTSALDINRLPGGQQSQVGTGNAGDKCYAKAGSLGWILCPIIASARTVIIESYGAIIEPALKMDTQLFIAKKTSQGGTYKAWDIFRNIGNFCFVVLFIIVIFSQLTGIGLDNYGVKKSLPKLLIAAILINLSFVICQGAIDVCNILGKGIGGLFQSITQDVTYPTSVEVTIDGQTTTVNATDEESWQDTNTWGSSFASNWLGNSAIVIIVAVLGIGIILSQGLAILIPVFMLFISIAVGIFGLIAILGIRQAAAVLLVVASPVAFVCYILPNTKPIFEKWKKAFQGLLLAYPACAALVYGGDMCATILLNSAHGNLWVIISAAVVSIAPIFLIPKVIRGSMGSISGGMANLATRFHGWSKAKARGRLEQTGLVNRRNYNQMMRNQRAAAGRSAYNKKKGQAIVDKYKDRNKMNAIQRRKYNAAMGFVNSDNSDSVAAYTSAFAAKSDGDITAQLLMTANSKKPDANMIVAGLNSIHDEDQLTATVRKLAETGALDKIKDTDFASYTRIADTLMSRKDSVINQSMGKLMAKGEGVREMWTKGTLKKKVQEAGTSVIASQNKDVFKTEGAAELFSTEQKRAMLTAGFTGATADAVGQVMSQTSEDEMKQIIEGMSSEEISSLNSSIITKKVKQADGSEKEEQVEVGSLAAIGKAMADKSDTRSDFEKGAALVKKYNESGVDSLSTADAREIRPGIQSAVAGALGIHAEAPGKPEDTSISGGIDIHNMTDDDYGYIVSQHKKQKEAEAAAAMDSGDIPIAHPTAPDLRSVEDTGTRRDASGRVIGSRAAEGNKFDYHPREAGESSKEYGTRLKYEDAVSEWAAKQPPKGKDETGEEYRARMKIPKSREEWEAGGGGKL